MRAVVVPWCRVYTTCGIPSASPHKAFPWPGLVWTWFWNQVEVIWVVTPCSVVVGYKRFKGPSCLHLHHRFRNVGILPQHCTASQPRRFDLNLHRCDNLKSRFREWSSCLICGCVAVYYTLTFSAGSAVSKRVSLLNWWGLVLGAYTRSCAAHIIHIQSLLYMNFIP
jgi:hypothetical protein